MNNSHPVLSVAPRTHASPRVPVTSPSAPEEKRIAQELAGNLWHRCADFNAMQHVGSRSWRTASAGRSVSSKSTRAQSSWSARLPEAQIRAFERDAIRAQDAQRIKSARLRDRYGAIPRFLTPSFLTDAWPSTVMATGRSLKQRKRDFLWTGRSRFRESQISLARRKLAEGGARRQRAGGLIGRTDV